METREVESGFPELPDLGEAGQCMPSSERCPAEVLASAEGGAGVKVLGRGGVVVVSLGDGLPRDMSSVE